MSLKPDPSVIGGVATPQFARLPDVQALFARRATRLRHLAASSHLAPYLRFLADICDAQRRIAEKLGDAASPDPEMIARNRSYRMPPLDRAALIATPMLALPVLADTAPPADAMKLSEILAKFETDTGADLAYIDEVDWDDDGYYEVEYRTTDGREVEVRLDPKTGAVRQ